MTDLSIANPWAYCACGHPWINHDVDDLEGSNPTCCINRCRQRCHERPPGSPIPTPVLDGPGYCPQHLQFVEAGEECETCAKDLTSPNAGHTGDRHA